MDLSPQFFQQYFDDDGNPLAGGKIYTYLSGTSTPRATYTDQTGGAANTNPIILDSAGRCNLWITTGYYKFVIKDANDVTIKTVDKVGLPGVAGTGLPSGGVQYQVLMKNSSSDYDASWANLNYINETSFTIVNGQSPAADVTGLLFDKDEVGAAIITYWIKRYTTGGGATEKTEHGTMLVSYNIGAETWNIVPAVVGPDASGVTFTITAGGQVQYTSDTITGTPNTSKMKFKATSMGT